MNNRLEKRGMGSAKQTWSMESLTSCSYLCLDSLSFSDSKARKIAAPRRVYERRMMNGSHVLNDNDDAEKNKQRKNGPT